MKSCLICGKEHRNDLFCSITCRLKWDDENKKSFDKVCVGCNVSFTVGQKRRNAVFCSKACYYESKNTERSLSRRANRDCRNCGGYIEYNRAKRANLYCSVGCSNKHQTQQVINAWLDNYENGTAKGGGLVRAIRLHLIKEANGCCTNCGRTDVHSTTGNAILEVDHVDGDRFNNHPDNLKVLCLNCHALTPTFKNLNKSKTVAKEATVNPSLDELKSHQVVVKWLEDNSMLNGKNYLSTNVRRYLIASVDYKCPKCGWGEMNPYTGRVPLEVDHIDGDAHNNHPDNLQVLCPQCHGCTPHYRALNKISSRTNRNKK